MECTQCTVHGMYTVNSVWNLQCTTHSVVGGSLQLWPGFPCGFSTKQLQVQIHNPKLCAKQKCLWELERGRGGALLCWAVTHFSCSALLHDSTLLWLDSTHSDENDAHAIIPAGDPWVTGKGDIWSFFSQMQKLQQSDFLLLDLVNTFAQSWLGLKKRKM